MKFSSLPQPAGFVVELGVTLLGVSSVTCEDDSSTDAVFICKGHPQCDTSALQHSKSSLHSPDPISFVFPQHDFSPLLENEYGYLPS